MKLQRAIKIKQDYLREHFHTMPQELVDADNISIEALKRITLQRKLIIRPSPPRLPGED